MVIRISDEGQPGRWMADARDRLTRLGISAEVTCETSPHGQNGHVVVSFANEADCTAFSRECAGHYGIS